MRRAARRVPPEPEAPPPLDLRLVPFALAVWAGCLLGLALGSRLDGGTVAGIGAGLLLATMGLLFGRVRRWGRVLAPMAGFVAAMLISVTLWRADAQNPLTVAALHGSWATVEITVTEAPRQVQSVFPVASGPTGQVADAQQWLVPARAELAVVGAVEYRPAIDLTVMGTGAVWQNLVPGERLRLGGLLAPDDYSVLPGVTVRSRTPPTLVRAAPWWQRAAARARNTLVANASGLPGDAAGLLPGLVVGNTDQISAALQADAKVTGLTHLLAVSGSHFALLCGLAILVLRGLGPRIAAVGGAVVLAGLVVLVGPGASVLRAAVMGGIALTAMALGRTRAALPALATAVILLLLDDPTLSRSVGFALSVQATAGLILLAPAWSKALQRRGWPAGWADLLAVPAAAHVATMPVIAALSGAVSLASIPANLLAALVVPPALVIGMGSALLGPWWPPAARALAHLDKPLLDWIAFVAHRLARWQLASVPWPASVPGVLGLAGLLVAVLLVLRQQRVRALVLAIVVGAGVVLIPAQVISVGWPPAGWVLMACEVGQGDGMVLSTGESGTAVVVDSGPDPGLIDACLTRLKIATVPLVVLTHLHSDHVDGLSGVLAGRSVGAIGVGPDRDAPAAWRAVNNIAAAHGIPVVGMGKGALWRSGDLTLHVLGPEGPFRGTDSDENNDSVVMTADIDGIRILMTGDIQLEAQQQLLNNHVDLRADVIEQPHHGSAKVLNAFVGAVHPKVAAIGVGLGNDYGQPSPKALAQLSAIGAVVLRTDLQGDSAVCVVDGRISTVTRGASLAAGSSQGSGTADGR